MATKKISDLATTTTPVSGALFAIVQSSSNFSVTLENMAANMPDLTATKLTSSSTITATSGFVGNITGNVTGNVTGNLTGNVTGNVSGSSGSTTGNAATATALQTARTIGGVSFDGTANINLPGVNTSGNQDTSGTAAIATTVTIADESTDTTCFPLFVTAASGNLAPKSASGLTFNSNTDVLSGTFSGNLTGNVVYPAQDIDTTWKRYSWTFTIESGPNPSNLAFVAQVRSANTSLTSEVQVTGVQLEPGPVATPFEHRPYATEIALCQRYYMITQFNQQGSALANGYVGQWLPFKSVMRATPTVSITQIGTKFPSGLPDPVLSAPQNNGVRLSILNDTGANATNIAYEVFLDATAEL